MELKFNSEVCAGAVFVYSEGGRRSAVSAQNWTDAEGTRLCQDLKCGEWLFNSVWDANALGPFWNATFTCKNKNPKSIWDCEDSLLALQDPKKQLFVRCKGKNLFLRDLLYWMMKSTF